MLNTGKLAGKTLFITGASRGIGKAIALKAAKDGANVVVAAKTAEPHPKLAGTIYTVAKEIEEAGGKALPCIVDVRDEGQVQSAVDSAVTTFGGIDILVNNASAISLTGTLETTMKKYDLMNQVNARGTFLASKCCIPYLKKSKNPHILMLSPPLSLNPAWFKNNVAYTMAKYGMSFCVLGMSEEFRSDNIAVNALWPRTAIATAAADMLFGKGGEGMRKDTIMADAAYVIITKDSKNFTGNFCIDDIILKDVGVTDLDGYAVVPGAPLLPDFFLDENIEAFEKYMAEGAPADKAPAAGGSASSATGDGQIAQIIKVCRAAVNEEAVKSIGAMYAFHITGAETGKWFLNLKTGSGNAEMGEPSEKVDVTLTLDAKDLVKMFSGTLKPTAAFMTGKLKIKGDMSKAVKLEKLLNKLRPKL